MYCNNCGNELIANAKFCNKCGSSIEIVINNTCLKCGNELPEGAIFCNVCGTKCDNSTNNVSMSAEEIAFCFKRGMECFNGKAFSAAVPHFKKAAEAGHVESQYNLAYMLHTGTGTIKNEIKATQWYLRAAMQGHADAQYGLFRQYILGKEAGVERNIAVAAQWLRLSVEQNCANALQFLGFVHDPMELNSFKRNAAEEKIIIPSNVKKAREYYVKSMENGNENAFAYIARIDMYARIMDCRRTNDHVGTENAIVAFMQCIWSFIGNSIDSIFMPVISQKFQKKLYGALSYATLNPNELPLMIIDSTIKGNGKEGILLTTQALYCKNFLEKPIKFSFDNMPTLTSRIDEKGDHKLFINNTMVKLFFSEREDVDLLIFIIQCIFNGFKYINNL